MGVRSKRASTSTKASRVLVARGIGHLIPRLNPWRLPIEKPKERPTPRLLVRCHAGRQQRRNRFGIGPIFDDEGESLDGNAREAAPPVADLPSGVRGTENPWSMLADSFSDD